MSGPHIGMLEDCGPMEDVCPYCGEFYGDDDLADHLGLSSVEGCEGSA